MVVLARRHYSRHRRSGWKGASYEKIRIHFISSGAGFVKDAGEAGLQDRRVRKTEFTEDANVRVTVEINRKYESG